MPPMAQLCIVSHSMSSYIYCGFTSLVTWMPPCTYPRDLFFLSSTDLLSMPTSKCMTIVTHFLLLSHATIFTYHCAIYILDLCMISLVRSVLQLNLRRDISTTWHVIILCNFSTHISLSVLLLWRDAIDFIFPIHSTCKIAHNEK